MKKLHVDFCVYALEVSYDFGQKEVEMYKI